MKSRERVPVVLLIALCAGCVTLPPPGAQLSESQVAELDSRARTPVELGVMTRSGTAEPGIRGTLPGRKDVIELNVRPQEDAQAAIVRILINGKLVLAAVDTGSALSFLEYDAAIRCGVTPVRPLTPLHGYGFGGPSEQFLAIAHRVQIGKLDVSKVPMGILNSAGGLAELSWIGGYRVEAILGNDFLSAFRWVTLDLVHEELTLSTDGHYAPDPARLVAAVPLRPEPGAPAIEGTIDGQGPYRITLDTGGEFGLWIPRALADRMKLPELEAPNGTAMAAALGGQTVFKRIKPRAVVAGNLRLPAVPTALGLIAMSAVEPSDALLGSVVLKDYAVTLDYGAGTVYFEKP